VVPFLYLLSRNHINKALLAAQNTGTSVKMIEQNYGKLPGTDHSALLDKVELA
jgi:hypothetical protein